RSIGGAKEPAWTSVRAVGINRPFSPLYRYPFERMNSLKKITLDDVPSSDVIRFSNASGVASSRTTVTFIAVFLLSIAIKSVVTHGTRLSIKLRMHSARINCQNYRTKQSSIQDKSPPSGHFSVCDY